VVCTQGGESVAGLKKGVEMGLVNAHHTVVVDSTSHQLKFAGFQQMYFEDSFPPEFEVTPKPEYQNRPQLLTPKTDRPEEKTLDLAGQIAALLELTAKGK
jgi:threonine synthase